MQRDFDDNFPENIVQIPNIVLAYNITKLMKCLVPGTNMCHLVVAAAHAWAKNSPSCSWKSSSSNLSVRVHGAFASRKQKPLCFQFRIPKTICLCSSGKSQLSDGGHLACKPRWWVLIGFGLLYLFWRSLKLPHLIVSCVLLCRMWMWFKSFHLLTPSCYLIFGVFII